jgi:hypothetical protein
MIVVRASLVPVLAQPVDERVRHRGGRGEERGAPRRIGRRLGRREDEAFEPVADDGEGVLDRRGETCEFAAITR